MRLMVWLEVEAAALILAREIQYTVGEGMRAQKLHALLQQVVEAIKKPYRRVLERELLDTVELPTFSESDAGK